jgi:hypothetical protein
VHGYRQTSIALLLGLTLAACGSASAQSRLDAEHDYSIEVNGTKADIVTRCLSPEAIRSLTGSMQPPYAERKPCYHVVMLTSSNSVVARAVQKYLDAEEEFARTATSTPDAGTHD